MSANPNKVSEITEDEKKRNEDAEIAENRSLASTLANVLCSAPTDLHGTIARIDSLIDTLRGQATLKQNEINGLVTHLNILVRQESTDENTREIKRLEESLAQAENELNDIVKQICTLAKQKKPLVLFRKFIDLHISVLQAPPSSERHPNSNEDPTAIVQARQDGQAAAASREDTLWMANNARGFIRVLSDPAEAIRNTAQAIRDTLQAAAAVDAPVPAAQAAPATVAEAPAPAAAGDTPAPVAVEDASAAPQDDSTVDGAGNKSKP